MQPSYRREYYSPEAERERYHLHQQQQQHHPAPMMVDDQRDSAPPKAAMSISSLLDSGRAASPSVTSAVSPQERIREGQRYISPQYKQEYHSRSRMYSASPPISPEERQRWSGAPITDLLDDGNHPRHPTALTVSDAVITPLLTCLTDSSRLLPYSDKRFAGSPRCSLQPYSPLFTGAQTRCNGKGLRRRTISR